MSAEKRNVTTGKWFILLLAVGMIALATWGSYKTVCVPDISPAGPQEDNSRIRIQYYVSDPGLVDVQAGIAVRWINM